MKKTKYFIKHSLWSETDHVCHEIIEQKEDFIEENKETIQDIDSEDLKVEYVGKDYSICILKLSYY